MAGIEMGRRIYHMTWDFKDKNWPVLRWEDEFTTGDGKWQVVRWEDEFTTGDGTSKMGSGKTNLPHDMGLQR